MNSKTHTERVLLSNNSFPAPSEFHVQLRVLFNASVIRLSNADYECVTPLSSEL